VAEAWISFLSDYGLDDEFVGVCHGVIARACPAARIIDLTHGIARHDVRGGALSLRNAIGFLPVGVHLAVVDPTVGARGRDARRSIALSAGDEGRRFVGPDNGLLMAAAEAVGGVVEAVDLGRSPFRLEPVAATFHGRDVFAPVAAALAAGAALAEVGEPLAIDSLVALDLPRADVRDGALVAHVLGVDRFGNVILDAEQAQIADAGLRLGDALEVHVGARRHPARYAVTFADVPQGGLILYEDAQRMAALAVNQGSASELLRVTVDGELLVRAG